MLNITSHCIILVPKTIFILKNCADPGNIWHYADCECIHLQGLSQEKVTNKNILSSDDDKNLVWE